MCISPKVANITQWSHSVSPSDHDYGHDYGTCSRGCPAENSESLTAIGDNDDDMEQQPLLKYKSGYSRGRSPFNWCKIIRNSLFVIVLLVCGSFLDSKYYEQKYDRQGRIWAAEQRKHVQQRAIWDDERRVQEINRGVWLREDQEHQAAMEKWAQEKATEQRKRDAISWQPLTPANHCLQYNTREYTSTLSNVPLSYDAREECAGKTVNLHGEQVAPTHCGSDGQCGAVVGHWISTRDEPSCQTAWAGPWDKGCQSPGVRHYHTALENMLSWDNWHEMCMTTPGTQINGAYHHSPSKCETWNGRVWGVWFVDDTACGSRFAPSNSTTVDE